MSTQSHPQQPAAHPNPRDHHPKPRPPLVVNQLGAVLPDGSLDPSASTDCGESCLASVVKTRRGIYFAPGDYRVAINGPGSAGSSSANQLAWALSCFRIPAAIGHWPASGLGDRARQEIDQGRHVIFLGYFQGPNELHWVLAYDASPIAVSYMDPWGGEYVSRIWGVFASQFSGTAVVVGP